MNWSTLKEERSALPRSGKRRLAGGHMPAGRTRSQLRPPERKAQNIVPRRRHEEARGECRKPKVWPPSWVSGIAQFSG